MRLGTWQMSEFSFYIGEMLFDGLASSSPLTIASSTTLSTIISTVSSMFSMGWKSSSIGLKVMGCNISEQSDYNHM